MEAAISEVSRLKWLGVRAADPTLPFREQFAMSRSEQMLYTERMALYHQFKLDKQHEESSEVIKPQNELLELKALQLKISVYRELKLVDMYLTTVPKALCSHKGEFASLQKLILANNQIVSIDAEMCFQLTSLNYLDFRNNSIKVLNRHIKAMMQLKFVFLDFNQLTSFPEELCSLRLLEELTLSHNKITNIPVDISNLNCLTTLHLNDNRISLIPDSLGQMKSLQILHLHGNQFTSFHCSIGALPTLNEFSLEWFIYAKPPKPKCVIKAKTPIISSSLQSLCQLPITIQNQRCDVVFFLETLSDVVFNVNDVDSRMRTSLHNAAAKGDIGVVKGLLQNRSTNPNLLDKDQCTPLCLAIFEEHFEIANILLSSRHVDVNSGGGIYGSPLHLAVLKLEVCLIEAMLLRGADPNKTDCEGKTPLHFIMNLYSKNGTVSGSITDLLVIYGANVNAKDNENWTPLQTAIRKNQELGVEAVIRLNRHICEPRQLKKFEINATGGHSEWSALHLAAYGGNIEIVRLLIENGADVYQRTADNKLARHFAKGNYSLSKFIKRCEDAPFSQVLRHEEESFILFNVTVHGTPELPQSSAQSGPSYTLFKTGIAGLQQRPFPEFEFLFVPFEEQEQHCASVAMSSSVSNEPLNSQNVPESTRSQKVNLFHLRDTLTKSNEKKPYLLTLQKIFALKYIEQHSRHPNFVQSIKPLLHKNKFCQKIKEMIVQKELIAVIGASEHEGLLEPLQELIECPCASLHPLIVKQIKAAILNLTDAKQVRQKLKQQIVKQPQEEENSTKFNFKKPIYLPNRYQKKLNDTSKEMISSKQTKSLSSFFSCIN